MAAPPANSAAMPPTQAVASATLNGNTSYTNSYPATCAATPATVTAASVISKATPATRTATPATITETVAWKGRTDSSAGYTGSYVSYNARPPQPHRRLARL